MIMSFYRTGSETSSTWPYYSNPLPNFLKICCFPSLVKYPSQIFIDRALRYIQKLIKIDTGERNMLTNTEILKPMMQTET